MAYSEQEIERRRQQCLKTKPWLKSTGATSQRGKAIVSQNALKTGNFSSFEPIRLLAKHMHEAQEMEKVRAITKKMQDAYESSNAQPHPFWEQIFESMTDDDFLRKLQNYKV